MKPLHFGEPGKELFGVYHRPKGRTIRSTAVVVCYPSPQEYMFAHWSLGKLSQLLARQGFHVLRFDYYATGDSEGASSEGTLDQWREDIKTAITELKDLSGASKVAAVGMRLGASLAAEVSATANVLADLVLWDPIVRGAPYVSELYEVQRSQTFESPDDELLGFPFPAALRQATERLNLLELGPCRVDRARLFVSEARPEYESLRAHLAEQGTKVDLEVVSEAATQTKGRKLDESMLAQAIPQAIAAALVSRGA